MLSVGDAAPDFVLPDADGNDVRLSSLGAPMVLYFYPKDHTPGCIMEARGFRDHHDAFSRRRATVVGVSLDPPSIHCSFRDRHELPFRLLSDEDGRIHDLYDAWRTRLFGRAPFAVRRCTYLIDGDGIIRRVYGRINVLNHAKTVLRDLDRLAAQDAWGQDT